MILTLVLGINFYTAYIIKKHLAYLEKQINGFLKTKCSHRMFWVSYIMDQRMGTTRPKNIVYAFSIVVMVAVIISTWHVGIEIGINTLHEMSEAKLYVKTYEYANYSMAFLLILIYLAFVNQSIKGYPDIDTLLQKVKSEENENVIKLDKGIKTKVAELRQNVFLLYNRLNNFLKRG